MQLYIKNMVCDRCILAIKEQLQQAGIPYTRVNLGEVELEMEPTPTQLDYLNKGLTAIGFELLDDKKEKLVEKVKNIIIALVHRNEEGNNKKLSALLEERLQLDYHYLSNLFSSTEGIPIEKYAIRQRIERVKELLTYNELSLSEIADQMGYSSVQHLSQQFKKETGMTPSQFRDLKDKFRKPLDKV
ncbi:MAG: helix-turn-helix domain-containing protein [Niastella sp.]|uniref:helix-turn-helix domain-containing protein n=1 Tax=Niastella sp. TaxID=1869183 RepID=UPI00389B37CD